MNLEKAKSNEGLVEEVIGFALSEIESKYGTGKGDGSQPLKYHNIGHTSGVMKAAVGIGKLALENGRINNSDIPLIRIAAAYHDLVQGLGPGVNESESARIASDIMTATGYFDEKEIEKVREMILSTRVDYENDGSMRQAAKEDDYLGMVIADADLSHLGSNREVYLTQVLNLIGELQGNSLTMDAYIAFMKKQVMFMSKHRYHTEEASRLYSEVETNKDTTELILEKLSQASSQ